MVRLSDIPELICLAVIAFGVYLLAGLGWALIVAGIEGLVFVTAEAWLPLLIARHGRQHGTDPRAQQRRDPGEPGR